MAKRKIVSAERGFGKFSNHTFVKLDCHHERAFGGHMYKGEVRTPGQLIGQEYDCQEQRCASVV